MKRSRNINRTQMKKRAKVLPVTLMASSSMVLLTACGGEPETIDAAAVFQSVEECVKGFPAEMTNGKTEQQKTEECQKAYNQAMAQAETAAPRYARLNDCEADFGDNVCRPNSSGSFMPFMAGFAVSSLLNNSMPLYRSSVYSSPYYSGWYSSDGYRYDYSNNRLRVASSEWGRVKTMKTPKTETSSYTKTGRTISRGGFGSVASSKSSWSSNRSSSGRSYSSSRSSSRGWGG